MDHNINIYSEALLPMSQGCEPSQVSSGSSQQQQQIQSCKKRSQAQQVKLERCENEEGGSEPEKEFQLKDLVVLASELTQNYCTTGCKQLDAELRGGIPAFGITELFGEGGSGKTQICLQLSITAQLKEEAVGLNSDVLYICTEDTFPTKRLAELVLHFQSKYSTELLPDPMSHVFVERIADSETLLQCVSVKLANLARISVRGIRLVVIDSVAAIFRSEFDDISRRTSELRRLGQILHEFSMKHDAAVLVCNQALLVNMRVDCGVLTCIHLDPGYALLSVQNTLTCMEMFNIIDVHRSNKINDVQFMLLLRNVTNLSRYEIEDSYEKEFIYRHSGTIFQLIDSDASGQISSAEFSHMGVLFNFDRYAIRRIFNEFDISGDKSLDFSEFRLFTMACIDEARAQETREKVKAFAKYRERLLGALEPSLRRFVRTDRLPRPREIEETVVRVRHPYIPGRKDVSRPFRYGIIGKIFKTTREEIRDYFKEKFGKIPCLFCFFGYILCCYCCIEDPLAGTEGKACRCKCKCRCIPCWFVFLRKLLSCCYCIFPCCHCCQPLSDHHQHIARKPKTQWPELTDSEKETELVNGVPQRGFHHHYHQPHHISSKSKTNVPNRNHNPAETIKDSKEFQTRKSQRKSELKTSGDPNSLEISKRRKMRPTPQPVEHPKWCRTQ